MGRIIERLEQDVFDFTVVPRYALASIKRIRSTGTKDDGASDAQFPGSRAERKARSNPPPRVSSHSSYALINC